MAAMEMGFIRIERIVFRGDRSYGFLLYDHFSPENQRNDVSSKRANDLADERSTRRFTLKRLGSREESFSFLEARPLREDYSLRLLIEIGRAHV